MRSTVSVVAALVSMALGAGPCSAQSQARSDIRVTLLGTGAPLPAADRFQASILVEAGDQRLLFDAGRGATIRLWQIRVPLGSIDALFITHFHSDHTVGIADLWLTGWLVGAFGGRKAPFHVIGPVGTSALMSNLEKAYALDVRIRTADEKLPPEGAAIRSEEFEQGGVVYEKDGVRVIAFEVDHGPSIKPAYGYRIEYRGHSVVLSGDTRYNQNVIKFGTGADVLIHEVALVRPELSSDPLARRIMAHHTSPREAGKVFSQAKPKLAVYSHIALPSNEKIPPATIDDIVRQTRESYQGALVAGEDLMSFEIGDTVVVRRWAEVKHGRL